MPRRDVFQNISGRATTAGAAEETLNLSVNGAVAAATVAVPAGSTLDISDITATGVAAGAPIRFRIQQTNDGAAFFDILELNLAAEGTIAQELQRSLHIIGGANVAIRARVTTFGGASLVSVNMQASLND